ncbi:MAG: alanine racemase [Clostridia bacterium]|nr:alanine racemase [Clostridia bacterium]
MENLIKTINIKNLEHNLSFIKNCLGQKKFCAVVKADAYGHGIKNVIKTIEKFANCFAVNNLLEAKSLRPHTKSPILCLSDFEPNKLAFAQKNDIMLSLSNKNQLKILENFLKSSKKPIKVHLKLDTGMNRLGIKNCYDFCDIKNKILKNKNIKLVGAFTHIGGGKKRTEKQKEKFFKMCESLPQNIITHYQSSSLLKDEFKKSQMARIGLMIYGYGDKNLKPVMSVLAKIIHIQNVKKGEYIGYGTKHKAKKDLTYGVISIGYSDGLMRTYSKKGYVLVNGKKAKFCANICMNLSIINLSNIKANVGDYATVLDSKLNAEIIAKKCKTISYEILTNFRNIKCTKKLF